MALPSPHHLGLSHRRGRGGLPHSRSRPCRARAFDARGSDRAQRDADLSEGISCLVRRSAMNRRQEPLRGLVDAVRALLERAGPEAHAFLRDWPPDLTPRPFVGRSLPVVSALDGLERFAAPETRALVQAVAALAGDLDWRQTYTQRRFRRALPPELRLERMDRPSAARSRATRSPAAFFSSAPTPNIPRIRTRRKNSISLWPGMPGGVPPSPTGGFARRDNGSIIPPGRPTPCAREPSPCSRPMSGARATSRRNRASRGERRRRVRP